MAKTRIRIEYGYDEKLDLTINNLEEDVADILVNDVLTTLQTATEDHEPPTIELSDPKEGN